jgi:hypothetical protein
VTRTGALVWKEWRDHRAAAFVFAALVPLVSWPVQRWVFKFAEPEWTWTWLVPLCAGLAVAVVASDAFAMDLATSRMNSFVALPVTLRRHFGARVTFLALVAAAIAAWTVAANVAIVSIWGTQDAVPRHFDAYDHVVSGLLVTAAGAGGVLVFSALGVGGFRAVFGGALLAAIGFVATNYAVERLFFAREPWRVNPAGGAQVEWLVTAATLSAAAFAGFVGGRAHAASRGRGAVLASSILVAAFGLPAGAVAWKACTAWRISPTDADVQVMQPSVSPDGRYVAVLGTKNGTFGGRRTWIVRVDDGTLFDWPRRSEWIYGWSKDGFAWSVFDRETPQRETTGYGRLVRPETGEVVRDVVKADVRSTVLYGYGFGPAWAQWMRWNIAPSQRGKDAPKGVSSWTLWSKDDEKTKRVVEARSIPAPTPRMGEALIATPDDRLAVIDLAGGEPRVVADDVVGLRGALTGSPDGRFVVVTTSKGEAVLDATTWKTVAGPYGKSAVLWCGVPDGPPVVAVAETEHWRVERLVNVATGREIVPDAAFELRGGHGSVHALADGRFVAQSTSNRIVLLDADGKFIRRLFPPEE